MGSHLVGKLRSSGAFVRALVRDTSKAKLMEQTGAEIVQGDLLDYNCDRLLRRAASGMDVVFHCAAKVSDWASRDEYIDVNVEGTENILKASLAEGVGRFVHLSSCEVYGNPGRENITESARVVYGQHSYTDSKIEAEDLVWKYHDLYELPAVILRPSTIYGPGANYIFDEIADLILNKRLILINKGEAKARLCYVENLVDAMIIAATHDDAVGQVYNVSDGCKTTWREVYEKIDNILKSSVLESSFTYRFSLPYIFAYLYSSVMEYAARIFQMSKRPRATRMGCRLTGIDQSFSIEAIRKLGFEPKVGFEKGIKRFGRWMLGEIRKPRDSEGGEK